MNNHDNKIQFEKDATYEIGKTKAVVVRNFKDKKSINTILSNLILADIEADIA